jgi:hypothetical protein
VAPPFQGFGSGGSVYGSTAPSMMNATSGMMGGMNMMQGNPAGGDVARLWTLWWDGGYSAFWKLPFSR